MSKNTQPLPALEAYFDKAKTEDEGGLGYSFKTDSLNALESVLTSLAQTYADQKWGGEELCSAIGLCYSSEEAFSYCKKLADEASMLIFSEQVEMADVYEKMIKHINALCALLRPNSGDYFPPKLNSEYFPRLGDFILAHLVAIQEKLAGKENTPPKERRAVSNIPGSLLGPKNNVGQNQGLLASKSPEKF